MSTSQEANLHCMHCGHQLPEGAVFCPRCGKAQRPMTHDEWLAWREYRTRNAYLALLLFTVGFGLLFLVMVLYTSLTSRFFSWSGLSLWVTIIAILMVVPPTLVFVWWRWRKALKEEAASGTHRRHTCGQVLVSGLLVGMLLVCGLCGLLGVRLALQPDEPLDVSVGRFRVWVHNIPSLPSIRPSSGISGSGVLTGSMSPASCWPISNYRIGDYAIILWDCL